MQIFQDHLASIEKQPTQLNSMWAALVGQDDKLSESLDALSIFFQKYASVGSASWSRRRRGFVASRIAQFLCIPDLQCKSASSYVSLLPKET